MKKRTRCIFVITFVALAFISMLGSHRNTAWTDNIIPDKQLAQVTETYEAGYEVSIETVKQDVLSGTVSGSLITEAHEDNIYEEVVDTGCVTKAPSGLTGNPVNTDSGESVTEAWEEPVTEAWEEPVTEAWEEPVTETWEEPVTEAWEEPVTEAWEDNNSDIDWKYLYVGDSRTKGLEAALIKYGMRQDNQTFISKIGEGYDFFIENMGTIKGLCDSSTVLIIALGINDMKYRYNEYITTINDMAATMDCRIYFMLVNPVNEAEEAADGKFNITNADIDQFNVRMLSGLSPAVKIIDTNSYLKNVIVNYTTMDGLHYTDETYIIVYNYLLNFLP